MEGMQPIQYTIRSIPPRLDRAIRQKAKKKGQSLNEALLEVLIKGTGMEQEMREHHDLDHFFGSWIEDSEVEKALKEQNRVDPKLWK